MFRYGLCAILFGSILVAAADAQESRLFPRFFNRIRLNDGSMIMQGGQVRHPVHQDEAGRQPRIDRLPTAVDRGLLGTPLAGSFAGFEVEYVYVGEVFTNMRGGRTTKDATDYMGAMNFAMHADLYQWKLLPGGHVFINAQNLHGQGITEQVGDFQTLSNLDAPHRTQISEFWWERDFFDEMIILQLGKMDVNAEFNVTEMAGDFIHSSFGFSPTVPMPSYPDPAMGVATHFILTDRINFCVGVFDGAAQGDTWGFSGTGDIFSVMELEGVWGDHRRGLPPGRFHAGLWYHNAQWEHLDGSSDPRDGMHGWYFGVEQIIIQEDRCDECNEQGLGIFVQHGESPGSFSEAAQYWGGGILGVGLIPCRDDDIAGIGIASLELSPELGPRGTEISIECFYKMMVTDNVIIQPDLQYIVRPSGVERDAFVFGLRYELAL